MRTRNFSVAICLAVMMSIGLTAQAQQKAKPGVSDPPKVDSGGLSVFASNNGRVQPAWRNNIRTKERLL
jgi:hypothetical protein